MAENNLPYTICLITPNHLTTNPRLVKEANALAEAGYHVKVIACRFMPWADAADQSLLSQDWHVVEQPRYGVIYAPRWLYYWQGIRRIISKRLLSLLGLKRLLVEYAIHAVLPELKQAACKTQANLYIAHNLAALPAAAIASKKYGAKLGFDAEDFHIGELPDDEMHQKQRMMIEVIERFYLPQCDYITAASPGIARAYAKHYAITLPKTILNVFPLQEIAITKATCLGSSVYWFSQTIGPNRGLEIILEAVAQSQARPHIYLQGKVIPEYGQKLSDLADSLAITSQLHFLDVVAPEKIIPIASQYDIGIAAEVGWVLNRKIAITNKLFTYLAAGIPILASKTEAQVEIADDMQGAMWLYDEEKPETLAQKMDFLLLDKDRLQSAKQRAKALSEQRFNWDIEKNSLIDIVAEVSNVN